MYGRFKGNGHGNSGNRTDGAEPVQVLASFRQAVIERFQISPGNRHYDYQAYLALPPSERGNDEADAVDLRFAHATLEWPGFQPSDMQALVGRGVVKNKGLPWARRRRDASPEAAG